MCVNAFVQYIVQIYITVYIVIYCIIYIHYHYIQKSVRNILYLHASCGTRACNFVFPQCVQVCTTLRWQPSVRGFLQLQEASDAVP